VYPTPYTALHYAVSFNHPAVVSQLLSDDDNINANLKDDRYRTPLKVAIAWNHHECVNILKDHGALE
jgi:ankyrin repeat protein